MIQAGRAPVITLTIDGRKVQTRAGRTILEVAREQGLAIPSLCYHEALEPFGACRLCVVEVEAGHSRQLVASCSFPVSDGLVVYTRSEAVLRSRRVTVELLLATARRVPLIRQLAAELGVGEPRFAMAEDDCIVCGLCVRACREIVGVDAITLVNRSIAKAVSPPFHIASDVCIRCGTCVLICPTGAISLANISNDRETVHAGRSDFDRVACRICSQQAQVREEAAAPLAGGAATKEATS